MYISCTWLDLEQTTAQELPVSDLPFMGKSHKSHSCFKNEYRTLSATARWKANTPLQNNPSVPILLWHSPKFLINKKDFCISNIRGVVCLGHLFEGCLHSTRV